MGGCCPDVRSGCKPFQTDLFLDCKIPRRRVGRKQIVRRRLICTVRIEVCLCSSRQWEGIPAGLTLPRIIQTADRVDKSRDVTPWRRLYLILTPPAAHERV